MLCSGGFHAAQHFIAGCNAGIMPQLYADEGAFEGVGGQGKWEGGCEWRHASNGHGGCFLKIFLPDYSIRCKITNNNDIIVNQFHEKVKKLIFFCQLRRICGDDPHQPTVRAAFLSLRMPKPATAARCSSSTLSPSFLSLSLFPNLQPPICTTVPSFKHNPPPHTQHPLLPSPQSMSSPPPPHLLRSVASAPGKLILFGEHAVVHDRPAVAVATSLRTTATLEQLQTLDIILNLPDICPDALTVPLRALQTCAALAPPSPTPCPPELLQLLQSLLTDHATQQQAANAAFVAAAVPALYLIVSIVIAPSSSTGLRLHVRSDLPVGAGLGSSAAFSVSVAAAALELSALSAAAAVVPPSPCCIERAVVNEWALQVRPACRCCILHV